MKILKKMTQFARMSFAIGYTAKFNKGEIQVNDNVINEVYTSMISAIKIESPEIDLVTERNLYIVDRVYPQYDPKNSTAYHVTVGDNIYICISNNNGAISKVAPSGTLLNNIIKSDGYVWAYIGKVNSDEVDQETPFISIPKSIYSSREIGSIARLKDVVETTNNFDVTPKYKIIGTGSNAIFDISLTDVGDISYISCANGGFGYSSNDYIAISDNFDGTGAEVKLKIVNGAIELESFTSGQNYTECTILVIGDGTDGTLSPTTLNGQLTDVTVQDGGKDYTWAKAFVFSSDRAILASLELMPMNGKATDPAYLLRANTWRIKKTLDIKDMDGYVYDNLEINLVSLIDQYNDNLVAGLNNKYTGNVQLKHATEVKEVFAVNKIEPIIIKTDERITLTLTVKLDDNKICQI